jgi:hypothetical protein
VREPNPACARLVYMLFAGLALVGLLLPLFVVEIPPILDYPNHLGRIWLLSLHGRDPTLSRMYAPDWHLIPNLAIDVVVPPLLRVFPLYAAGRVALAMTLLLPVTGTIVLHRAIHRRWSVWPLASCLIAYNVVFLLGFMNFLLGVGVALLTAAAWTALRPRRPLLATLALSIGATAIFFCHVVALLLLVVIVVCTQAESLITRLRRRERLLRTIMHDAAECAAGFLMPACLYLDSSFDTAGGNIEYLPVKMKLVELLSPVLTYDVTLDVLTAVVISGCVVTFLMWRGDKTVLPVRIGFATGVLLLMFVAAPFRAKGGAWLDLRFPVMAAFLLFAGLAPPALPRMFGICAGLAIGMLFVLRTAKVVEVWYAHEAYVDTLRGVVAQIPPGSRVIVARTDPQLNRRWWHEVPPGRRLIGFGSADDHLAVLLLIERRAFSPLLFANPTQQPIQVLKPYRKLSVPSGYPPDYARLAITEPTGKDAEEFPYLRDWPENFDFALMVDSDGAPNLSSVLSSNPLLSERLHQVVRTDFATLYSVCRPGPCQ